MRILKKPKFILSLIFMCVLSFSLITNALAAGTQKGNGDLFFDIKLSAVNSVARSYELIHSAYYGLTRSLGFHTICTNCGSEEHSSASCLQESISAEAVGTWNIPAVGVEVDCYNSSAQLVCDNKNSASYYPWNDQMVIADHWYQGFNAIKLCKEGMIAYFESDTGIQEYVCTGVLKGHNTITELTDQNGDPVHNPGGITCYTCNGSWENVTIVFFQPVQ